MVCVENEWLVTPLGLFHVPILTVLVDIRPRVATPCWISHCKAVGWKLITAPVEALFLTWLTSNAMQMVTLVRAGIVCVDRPPSLGDRTSGCA